MAGVEKGLLESRNEPLPGRESPHLFCIDETHVTFLSDSRGRPVHRARAPFVEEFTTAAKRRRPQWGERQRELFLAQASRRQLSKLAAKIRSRRDAAAVVATDAIGVSGEPVKARYRVAGHADRAKPFMLEANRAQVREQPAQGAGRPVAVKPRAGGAKRADAAEYQAAGLIKPGRGQDGPRVPHYLPLRQYAAQRLLRQR